MTEGQSVPVAGIVELLTRLVRIPSRSPGDDLGPVLDCLVGWLDAQGLRYRVLAAPGGAPLGIYAEVGPGSGPWIVLDATLDTADFGDPSSWSDPPCSAMQREGWLYGRGAADSKAGAAIFAHLLAEWANAAPARLKGRLGLLLDLDEHSGRFGGAKAFFDAPMENGAVPRPDAVVIGYPGDHELVIGSRGFLRARIGVAGVAAHSGAVQDRGVNAVERAAALVTALTREPLDGVDPTLGLAPQLTVVGFEGGSQGYSQVPDRAELRVDIRLTTRFDDAAARHWVCEAVRRDDERWPLAAATSIEWIAGWPAYRVPEDHFLVRALQAAAAVELRRALPSRVVGPSNIGNYLAGLGVAALAGFGVRCTGVHAADEGIELAGIAPVYRTYRRALQDLLMR